MLSNSQEENCVVLPHIFTNLFVDFCPSLVKNVLIKQNMLVQLVLTGHIIEPRHHRKIG